MICSVLRPLATTRVDIPHVDLRMVDYFAIVVSKVETSPSVVTVTDGCGG